MAEAPTLPDSSQGKHQVILEILQNPTDKGYDPRILAGDINGTNLTFIGSISLFADAADKYKRIRLVDMPDDETKYLLSFLSRIPGQRLDGPKIMEWNDQATNRRLSRENRPYVVLAFCEYMIHGSTDPQQLIYMCTENGMSEDTALAFLSRTITDHISEKIEKSELNN